MGDVNFTMTVAYREIKIIINEETAEILENIRINAVNANMGEENITPRTDLTDSKLLELVLALGIRSLLLGDKDLVFNEEKEEWLYE